MTSNVEGSGHNSQRLIMFSLVPNRIAIVKSPLQNTLWQFSQRILFFGPDLIYYTGAQYEGCYV